jgi:hypothetical protein
MVLMLALSLGAVTASADESTSTTEETESSSNSQYTCNTHDVNLRWWSLVYVPGQEDTGPGQFLPLIPDDCARTEEGQARALSPILLGDIFLRGYGFLASLMFLLLTPMTLVAGIWWTWSGFYGGNPSGAKTLFQNMALGLVVVIGFYYVVSILLNILGYNEGLNTSLEGFFTFPESD